MKRTGKIAICLVSGLALNAALRAADTVPPGNPYAPLVTRNVFGLNPPIPVDANPVEPPVKITPNGIMSIFGRLQVLFKASNPPAAGKPAGETSYILSEGQRQDDIEVTHIDEKAGVVTFNNHGIVQELPLTKTPNLTAPVTESLASGNNPASGLAGDNSGGNNNPIPFGGRFGNRNRGNRNSGDNSGGGYNSGSGYNNSSSSGYNSGGGYNSGSGYNSSGNVNNGSGSQTVPVNTYQSGSSRIYQPPLPTPEREADIQANGPTLPPGPGQ